MSIQLEICEPYYIDNTRIKTVPYNLRRLDNSGKRVYYRMDNGEPRIYTGVTSMIKNTLPTSPQLIEYFKKNGSNSDDLANEAADYGTFMHIIAQKLLVYGEYDFSVIEHDMRSFCMEKFLDPESFIRNYKDKIQKDTLAFAQWVLDYNVKPISIEQVLCHDQHGYAGAIDLVCELTIEEKGFFGELYKSGPQKGTRKESKKEVRVLAIVDFKSGRKGFWESHEIQLMAYKNLIEYNYPELKVDKLYNWSPKDWISTPSYNFKDQTNCWSQKKLPHLVELYRMDNDDANKRMLIIDPIINLKEGNAGGFKEITYYDYIKIRENKDGKKG
jgi:hypothetical protein